MTIPAEQFERVRQDYLKKSFPGDLTEVLGLNRNSPDPTGHWNQLTSRSSRDEFPTKVMWTLAVLFLVGVAVGAVWMLNRDSAKLPVANNDSTDLSESIATAKATRSPIRLALLRPVALDAIQIANSKARFFNANLISGTRVSDPGKKVKSFVFTMALRKNQKAKLWNTGAVRLAHKPAADSTATSSKLNGNQKHKASRPRAKFRSRIQFEPIGSYRRS